MTNHSAGGLSKKEKFFTLFNNARCRVTDPTNPNYPRYGARGIKFLWTNYLDFKKDMCDSYVRHQEENGPNNTTLERIDNDGPYSKENCRWATWAEQAKNRRTSRYLTYKGETMIIADWARRLNTSRQTIRNRVESGWEIEDIINTSISYANRKSPKT